MYIFKPGNHLVTSEIFVEKQNGEPTNTQERERIIAVLNKLSGFDDDTLWDEPTSGSRLRVAEMLENHTEPDDVTETLRKLGGVVIRSLVRELAETKNVK